jgi:hypothetical protein
MTTLGSVDSSDLTDRFRSGCENDARRVRLDGIEPGEQEGEKRHKSSAARKCRVTVTGGQHPRVGGLA